jgi:hypothetical protein
LQSIKRLVESVKTIRIMASRSIVTASKAAGDQKIARQQIEQLLAQPKTPSGK